MASKIVESTAEFRAMRLRVCADRTGGVLKDRHNNTPVEPVTHDATTVLGIADCRHQIET